MGRYEVGARLFKSITTKHTKGTKDMKSTISILLFVCLLLPFTALAQKGSFAEIKQLQSPQNPRIGFIIHGGAGGMKRGSMTPERETEYRAKLSEALMAGYKALQDGKTS